MSSCLLQPCSIFSNKIPASKFITIAFQKLGKRVFYFFYSTAVTLEIISTAGNDITGVCYILLFSLLLLFIFVVALLREAILRRFLGLKHSTFEPFFSFTPRVNLLKLYKSNLLAQPLFQRVKTISTLKNYAVL